MGDNQEYCGGANWWEPSSAHRSSRFDTGGSSTPTTSLAASGGVYGWMTEPSTAANNINSARSSLDLGLDWNQQPILRNNPDFHEEFGSQLEWREKLFTTSNEESLELKQIESSRSFSSLEQQQDQSQSESMEETGLATPAPPPSSTFHSHHLESSSSSSVYGSPSNILQGFIAPHQHQQEDERQTYQQNYFDQQQLSTSWAKVPQFLKGSPPKQQQQQQQYEQQLQFSNSATYDFRNPVDHVRPNFFSSLQTQLPTIPTFDHKPKNTMEVKQSSSGAKKGGAEMSSKRGRNEAANSSSLPPFKVRKEKMGDRITALQQLVSPFGKTDTASVLSEAIEYIKFLHEQVSVLTTPYLKNGGSYQQQHQNNEKGKMDTDRTKQDLRSQGLCLVPVSSTFPVAHESTVDFWTPTFGGTFR